MNLAGALPEVAAFGVMTLLCKHPSKKVDNEKHPVALMAPPYVLTEMAARTYTQIHKACLERHPMQLVIGVMLQKVIRQTLGTDHSLTPQM